MSAPARRDAGERRSRRLWSALRRALRPERGRARAPLLAAGLALAPVLMAPSHAQTPPVHYAPDMAASRLQFSGVQEGAPFTAVFHTFTAAIDFSPDALSSSRFDVQITLASVDSKDQDRDGTMRGTDLFDVARYPTAHYVTRSITRTASGYTASGLLTLHGVTREVPIQFTFQNRARGAELAGTAQLKRLDFGVGQGDWKSTDGVANEVKVAFDLQLLPAP